MVVTEESVASFFRVEVSQFGLWVV